MSGRKLSHPRHHSVDTDPDGRLVAVHRHMDVRSVDLGRAPYELDELALHPGAVDAARRALHPARSDARRVGKGVVSTCRARWSTDHYKKKNKYSATIYN